MRLRFELMQLEIVISTMRYLPASGTAGLERSLVSGKRRVPAPPPMMMARVFSVMEGQLEGCIVLGFRGVILRIGLALVTSQLCKPHREIDGRVRGGVPPLF